MDVVYNRRACIGNGHGMTGRTGIRVWQEQRRRAGGAGRSLLRGIAMLAAMLLAACATARRQQRTDDRLARTGCWRFCRR